MNGISVDKRYKGLHYEVGQLPKKLVDSTFYWQLPHDVRRCIYFLFSPIRIERLRRFRTRKPENSNAQSLRPFYDTKSIFVHIPKAAGISVGYSLYGRKTGDHRTILDYQLCCPKKTFESFFKFSFVRNPWDRLFSAYSYMKKGGRNNQDLEWSKKYLSQYNSFEEFVTDWINEDNINLGLHFKPQYKFICSQGNNLEVDFICYFENIEDDYKYIRNKLNIGQDLVFENKTTSKKKDYRDYYTDETKEIVRSVYQKDIELFGYNFDGSSLHSQLAQRAKNFPDAPQVSKDNTPQTTK